MRPLLAVSIGCPAGIGPEVSLVAASKRTAEDVVLFGDLELLRERAGCVGVAVPLVEVKSCAEARGVKGAIAVIQSQPPLRDRRAGRPSPEGGAAQLGWIDAACDAVDRREADALVTGPASKHAIASSGAPGSADFLGHTEHLGARLGRVETVMAFYADALTISLATTHLPLAAVASTLRPDHVARAIYWTTRLVDELKIDPTLPVAVLALNPHAGEQGLLGDEERTIVGPGIEKGRKLLAAEGRTRAIVGPIPAEAGVRKAARDKAYAACVAMYHDQATVPSKLVAFGDAVNVTLGLPIIRTSVDHGTAYDLAGTGKADARGMSAAMDLAARLVCARR
ncbi:MAG: PdxA family dehydrogenase [Polyangiales bacterium]